jgi:hypothetical protein
MLTASPSVSSGDNPSAVIDTASGKLLVVTGNGSIPKPALFRCNLDGTACTYTDISAGQAGAPRPSRGIVLDDAYGDTAAGEQAIRPALPRSSWGLCDAVGSRWAVVQSLGAAGRAWDQ